MAGIPHKGGSNCIPNRFSFAYLTFWSLGHRLSDLGPNAEVHIELGAERTKSESNTVFFQGAYL